MSFLTIENEQHWHALRAAHIGASEVAGLFSMSPYATAYSIYQTKIGAAPAPTVDESAVEVGRIMEAPIAELYAKRNQLDLVKNNRYAECDDQPFLGATLDYHYLGQDGFPIVAEIKHVSTWAWRDHEWSPENDFMPMQYELQVVAQLLCTGWKEARLVAFCDGELYSFTRKRGDESVEKLAAQILERVANMKNRIAHKDEPDALGEDVDLEVMGKCVKANPDKPVLDMTADKAANDALHDLSVWQDNKRAAEKGIDEAKAKVTQIFARASNDGTVATEMVTTHYRLKRTQSELAAVTIQRKASVTTRFTVKMRDDALPEAIPDETRLAGG